MLKDGIVGKRELLLVSNTSGGYTLDPNRVLRNAVAVDLAGDERSGAKYLCDFEVPFDLSDNEVIAVDAQDRGR